MGELITGKQVAAGRILAGLTQKQLADAAGLHVNSIRYVERQPRITTGHSCQCIKQAMLGFGIVFFRVPTPGVRLAGEGEFGIVGDRQLIRDKTDGELSPGTN